MNKVVLIGRLTKDPELRYTPGNGTAVTKATIAVDNYNSKTGEKGADFIPVVIWGKQAENTAQYMTKGSQVAISGRITTRSYDAKDGTKRYVTEVVVENIEFVGGRNEGSSSPMSNNAYMDAPSEAPMDVMPEYDIPKSDPYENYDKEVSLSDNDLPF